MNLCIRKAPWYAVGNIYMRVYMTLANVTGCSVTTASEHMIEKVTIYVHFVGAHVKLKRPQREIFGDTLRFITHRGCGCCDARF